MSFGGIPASQLVQDYYLWEYVLNDNPQLRGIVELGTWEGGFANYLAAQAQCRGLSFRTYDIASPFAIHGNLVPGFRKADIFREAESIGEYLRQEDPVIVLCDGGNKPRELKTFSRFLGPDSRMVTHDWGTEVTEADVPPNLEMLYGDTFSRYQSMSRVFRVV